jgi:hypothetical protein
VCSKINPYLHQQLIISLGGSDYPDVEFGVLLFNSSQQTRNVSIPIISSKLLRVSLRLLSDGFSCAAVEPSTAHIIILDTTDDDNDAVCNCVDDMNGKDKGTCSKPVMYVLWEFPHYSCIHACMVPLCRLLFQVVFVMELIYVDTFTVYLFYEFSPSLLFYRPEGFLH